MTPACLSLQLDVSLSLGQGPQPSPEPCVSLGGCCFPKILSGEVDLGVKRLVTEPLVPLSWVLSPKEDIITIPPQRGCENYGSKWMQSIDTDSTEGVETIAFYFPLPVSNP